MLKKGVRSVFVKSKYGRLIHANSNEGFGISPAHKMAYFPDNQWDLLSIPCGLCSVWMLLNSLFSKLCGSFFKHSAFYTCVLISIFTFDSEFMKHKECEIFLSSMCNSAYFHHPSFIVIC